MIKSEITRTKFLIRKHRFTRRESVLTKSSWPNEAPIINAITFIKIIYDSLLSTFPGPNFGMLQSGYVSQPERVNDAKAPRTNAELNIENQQSKLGISSTIGEKRYAVGRNDEIQQFTLFSTLGKRNAG